MHSNWVAFFFLSLKIILNTFHKFLPGLSISMEDAKYGQSEKWYSSRRSFTFENEDKFVD